MILEDLVIKGKHSIPSCFFRSFCCIWYNWLYHFLRSSWKLPRHKGCCSVMDQITSFQLYSVCSCVWGSALGPLLFRLYMLPLATLMESLGFSYHFYDDDTQIYLSFFSATIDILQTGYNKISDWLSSNFLKLNHNKTEILLIGSSSYTETLLSHTLTLQLGPSTLSIKSLVKNIGVTFVNAL